MAEDPSKSLFTFEHLFFEMQWGFSCDPIVSADNSLGRQRQQRQQKSWT